MMIVASLGDCKRPTLFSFGVANELIHPNWHVVLIHYPLALLTIGLAIELFGFLYRHSTFRLAGRWMLLIGALACVPTATSGLYAYYDTVRYAGQGEVSMEPGGDAWYQLTRAAEGQLTKAQWDDLKHHMWRAGSGTIIVLLGVIPYLGASDRWRRRLYWPCLLLVGFAVGVLAWGAWYAGESVSTRGTSMKWNATPAGGAVGAVPPLQLHVVLAGLTMALAIGALGLSMRKFNVEEWRAKPPSDFGGPSAEAEMNAPAVQTRMIVIGEPVHAGRFWLIAAVLGLGTAAAGIWVAGGSWEQIQPLLGQHRDLAHLGLGAAIILLALMLGALMRWSDRRRGFIVVSGTLLLAAVAAQVWVGILLMYDGSDKGSSVLRFRSPVVQVKQEQGH
jgi:uncharacterized membrane protein